MTQKAQYIIDNDMVSWLHITNRKRNLVRGVSFHKEPNGEIVISVSILNKKNENYFRLETLINKQMINKLRKFLEKGDH